MNTHKNTSLFIFTRRSRQEVYVVQEHDGRAIFTGDVLPVNKLDSVLSVIGNLTDVYVHRVVPGVRFRVRQVA